MRPVRLEPEAEAELHAAAQWYDAQRPGLGSEFVATVGRVFTTLADPHAVGAPVPGLPMEHPARRVVLRRFPYTVVFLEKDAVVRILAIAHQRRRPGYWAERVRS